MRKRRLQSRGAMDDEMFLAHFTNTGFDDEWTKETGYYKRPLTPSEQAATDQLERRYYENSSRFRLGNSSEKEVSVTYERDRDDVLKLKDFIGQEHWFPQTLDLKWVKSTITFEITDNELRCIIGDALLDEASRRAIDDGHDTDAQRFTEYFSMHKDDLRVLSVESFPTRLVVQKRTERQYGYGRGDYVVQFEGPVAIWATGRTCNYMVILGESGNRILTDLIHRKVTKIPKECEFTVKFVTFLGVSTTVYGRRNRFEVTISLDEHNQSLVDRRAGWLKSRARAPRAAFTDFC